MGLGHIENIPEEINTENNIKKNQIKVNNNNDNFKMINDMKKNNEKG